VKLRKYTLEELVEWLKGNLDKPLQTAGRPTRSMVLKMIREKEEEACARELGTAGLRGGPVMTNVLPLRSREMGTHSTWALAT